MKRILPALLSLICLMCGSIFANAAEAPIQNAPYLESISFSNADIDGGFRTGETHFTLTLQNPNQSAALQSYTVNGSAKVIAAYQYDNANHQTGITVTLEFDSGSVIYTFTYSNAPEYSVNSNANLAEINCEYGEVRPEINSEDTAYKLYVPSDLTEINITPVTQDINATATSMPVTLREGQETEIPITVTASDGTTKKYVFDIIRVNKTIEEVKAEMAQPGYVSFVDGERFYEQPVFAVTVGAVAGGLIVILIIAAIVKRVAANPYDEDEKEFYSPVE